MRPKALPTLALAALLLGAVSTVLADTPAPEPGGAAGISGPTDEERAEVRRMVDELRAEAARIRGLDWIHPVPADLLTREQLRANLDRMVEEEVKPEELERDTRILRRLKLLEPEQDPLGLMLEMHQEMVAGYYNPKEKKLFLVQGMVGEGQKPVILHELVHALEDQYLDLESRTERWKDDSDRMFAEQCLGEGSAEHARELYQKANPAIAQSFLAGQQDPDMAARQMKILQKVPAYMLVSTLLHYDVGPKLVRRYVGEDYPGGIARLRENPPVSQEQFLHASRFLGAKRDYPQAVTWSAGLEAAAGEAYETLYDTTSGELDLTLYLDYFLGAAQGRLNPFLMAQGKYYADRAAEAGKGWDGGRSLYLERDDGAIAWLQVYAFDSTEDATEAADALLAALQRAYGETFQGGAFENDKPTVRTADYQSEFGLGRLGQVGDKVYLVDGVDEQTLGRLWPEVLETSFVRDLRDTYDPADAAAIFEGSDLVNTKAGVGVRLPDGWEAADAPDARTVLAFGGEDVTGSIVLQRSPMGLEMIQPMLEQSLKAQFPALDVDAREEVTVAGGRGYRYALGAHRDAPEGPRVTLYVADAPGALLILRFSGTEEALAQARASLDHLAREIVLAE